MLTYLYPGDIKQCACCIVGFGDVRRSDVCASRVLFVYMNYSVCLYELCFCIVLLNWYLVSLSLTSCSLNVQTTGTLPNNFVVKIYLYR